MLGDIYKMALGVVPGSVLGPFVSGNTLQVLFLAACSGVLVLILGQQIRHLTDVIREVNVFLMTAISYFCYAVPVIIYLSFTGLLLGGEFDSFLRSRLSSDMDSCCRIFSMAIFSTLPSDFR